jgi:hypothetical protein
MDVERVPVDHTLPRRKSRWRRRLLVIATLALAAFVYSLQFHPQDEDWTGQRTLLAHRARSTAPVRIDSTALLRDLQALSAPAMEGRAVGTPGGKRARDYIAGRFAGLGLEPAFGRSYEQAFSFVPGRGIRFWRAKFWQARSPIAGVNLAGLVRGTRSPQQ